jgi:hypothetical protein
MQAYRLGLPIESWTLIPDDFCVKCLYKQHKIIRNEFTEVFLITLLKDTSLIISLPRISDDVWAGDRCGRGENQSLHELKLG